MTMVAAGLVIAFAVYIFRNYWWRIIQARWYGTETEAQVSRIEEEVRTSNGAEYPQRFYYVMFPKENGLQNEARLLNPKSSLVPGSSVKVMYLLERADVAVLTEIEKR